MHGRSPRSRGSALARRMFAAHEEARRSGRPPEEVLGELDDRPTRRELLAGAVGLAGATLAAGSAPAFARKPSSKHAPKRPPAGAARVAIVGAGLAGLRCGHMLWTESPGAPVAATVYEANPERAGGRCWTLRDFFTSGLISEHGGAFLNSNQTAVRALAAKLGLHEEIVGGGDLPEGSEVFLIGGRTYTEAEAQADWEAVGYDAFRRAAKQLRSSAGEARLDAMSVPEWLDSTPIGAHSRFGRLMLANAVTENGGDPGDMSALDLIELLTHNPRSALVPLPGDDERYHLIGGNDQLVSGMIAALPPGTVRHGMQLEALRENSDRTLTLSFLSDAAASEVTADYVVLALPFSTLRECDLSRAGLPADKRRVIRTMGMGTNAKIHLELERKTWPAHGYSGASYGEWNKLACAWDDTVQLGPSATPALWLAFPGASMGASGLTGAAHGPAPAVDTTWALSQIEPLFTGTTAAFTGLAYEDHWALDPWVQGAYSYYRVGQAASYGAIAGRTDGHVLFAGEHTSIANIGFLDGAVETGERAAGRLLRRLM